MAAIEDMRAVGNESTTEPELDQALDVDDDWLNIFERHAEDASTERMQRLWGRVLAGEIRKPGSFAPRTLRFLSEFSQADAITFLSFCENAFGEFSPSALVKDNRHDIRDLIRLESSDLIQGALGLGLTFTLKFNGEGKNFLIEGNMGIMLISELDSKIPVNVLGMSLLGQQVMRLITDLDVRVAARKVAESIRGPLIK